MSHDAHFEHFPPTLAEEGDGQERHIGPPSGLQARENPVGHVESVTTV
jgi:hypothetical protein